MNNWFVANDDGIIAGHDLNEYTAKTLAKDLQKREPEQNWEAMENVRGAE